MKRYRILSSFEKQVIEEQKTERAGTGVYHDHFAEGVYVCKRCGAPLYLSSHKFLSPCGWPSFDDEIEGAVEQRKDRDGQRIEIICRNCKGHLGHVFTGEGFTQKNLRHCVNSVSMDFIASSTEDGMLRAFLGGGCFWGVEYFLQKEPGVLRTKVGYMGGNVADPTYEEVCSSLTGHVEVVEVIFDPSIISYENLIKLFFEIHDPFDGGGQGPDRGSQYLSTVFYLTQEQKQMAFDLKRYLEKGGEKVHTRILPASFFYPAEDYHQQYYLKTSKVPYCHRRQKRF